MVIGDNAVVMCGSSIGEGGDYYALLQPLLLHHPQFDKTLQTETYGVMPFALRGELLDIMRAAPKSENTSRGLRLRILLQDLRFGFRTTEPLPRDLFAPSVEREFQNS